MYGYITVDNMVGQLFDKIPPDDMYHISFLERIIELPEGVTSGWQYTDGEFLPPQEQESNQISIESLLEKIELQEQIINTIVGYDSTLAAKVQQTVATFNKGR